MAAEIFRDILSGLDARSLLVIAQGQLEMDPHGARPHDLLLIAADLIRKGVVP